MNVCGFLRSHARNREHPYAFSHRCPVAWLAQWMQPCSRMRKRFFRWLRSRGLMVPQLMVPLVSVACAANGNGNSEINGPTGAPDQSVTLVWSSEGLGPDHGPIAGSLPDGTHYAGNYIEVMAGAGEGPYASIWEGWEPYWSEWDLDGDARVVDWPRFIESYRGTVVANLKSDDGTSRLRCRFIIDTPATGMAGGSNGLCQRSDGETLDYVVLEPGGGEVP